MILAIPAATWALMAQDRIKNFSEDFWAMHSGLLLLFLVSIGTIAFPAITTVALGADMPPLWALQGLFLFVILIVCGASYPIERFYSVNLLVLAIGIALVAGRLIQTWAMWSTEVAGPGRGIGQTLTWLSIAALALLNLSKLI